MRGKVAKKIRKEIYGKDSARERTYIEENGIIKATGKRKEYQLLKKR